MLPIKFTTVVLELCPHREADFILKQDNIPVHRERNGGSRETADTCNHHPEPAWSPNVPDLNPVDHAQDLGPAAATALAPKIRDIVDSENSPQSFDIRDH